MVEDWFDVLDEENRPVLTEREILRNLKAIVADADTLPTSEVRSRAAVSSRLPAHTHTPTPHFCSSDTPGRSQLGRRALDREPQGLVRPAHSARGARACQRVLPARR